MNVLLALAGAYLLRHEDDFLFSLGVGFAAYTIGSTVIDHYDRTEA